MKKNYLSKKNIFKIFALSVFIISAFFNFTFADSAPARIVIPPIPLPQITRFTIDGSSDSLYTTNNFTTFVWNSVNTISCSVSASNSISNWSGTKPTQGTEQVSTGQPGSVRYTLTCFNSVGSSTSRSVVVNMSSLVNSKNNTNFNCYCSGQTGCSCTNNSVTNTNTNVKTNTCAPQNIHSFSDLVNMLIGCIFSRLIYLIIALAVVVFLWGVFRFIRSEGEEDRKTGREFMLWGIVGLFVMVSIWGLVAIFQSTLIPANTNYNITPRTININTSSLQ